MSDIAINTTAEKIETMANMIIDDYPVEDSENLVKSGGVFGAIPDISGKENISNKVTEFSKTPSDEKYPSEKLVADNFELVNEYISQLDEVTSTKENISNKVTALSENSTDSQYPSAKAVYTAIENVKTNIEGDLDSVSALIGGAT